MIFGTKRGFSRGRHGITLRLDRDEADLLVNMLTQLDGLVGESETADEPLGELLGLDSTDRPDDPALLRLFPDAYLDDDEAAGDFRRFTQRGLRTVKSERVRATVALVDQVDADGAPVPVTPELAATVLGALNDLRLVLGVRLGIVADDQDVTDGWADDDPRLASYGAYQWLTWLQAGLLDAMGSG
ncbi:MAG: DUF2017 domain-containing protein [Candidatus Nanopelagicales bacterium]